MRNQEEKIELQKNVRRRICVTDITFFGYARSFQCRFFFRRFFCLLPPLTQAAYLLNGPYKDTQQ